MPQALQNSGFRSSSIKDLVLQSSRLYAAVPAAPALNRAQLAPEWPAYHIALRFKRLVSGPVQVGLGRHYGLGLFAPMD